MIAILFLGFLIVVALYPSVLDSHEPEEDKQVYWFHGIYLLILGHTKKSNKQMYKCEYFKWFSAPKKIKLSSVIICLEH